MPQTAQPTKTPWELAEGDIAIIKDGRTIATAWPNPKTDDGTMYANAAHIVRCVNLHAELVEALEAARDFVDCDKRHRNPEIAAYANRVCDQAAAVLTKAKSAA